MNTDRLLALYEQVAEAPNAIASLRRFVLDLAVRGKLVAQDSTDEPARLKQDFKSADLPFGLPAIWRWMSVGDQLDLINGMAFKPTDWVSEGIRIVRIQNLNKPDAPFNFCQPETARERSLIDDGSFLISWSGTPGTSFGAFIWDRGPAVLNQHIFRCDFKTSLFDPILLSSGGTTRTGSTAGGIWISVPAGPRLNSRNTTGCAKPEIIIFQGIVKNSPNPRSQQVQRIPAPRDRFQASRLGGRLTAPSA